MKINFGLKNIGLIILILVAIIGATFFHYPIHFENALTLTKAVEYEVKISIWRILFEPFLGPLMYFNRAIYALQELVFTMLWVLIFYLVFSVTTIFKNQSNRIEKIKEKTASLFLVLGICFSFFVLMLFIHLPNNTIINNSEDSVLVTTHAHTEFSHDGLISQQKMWDWHKRNGFDAFFITDHANHIKSFQFAQAQRNGEFPKEPLVMVGEEYSASNHMSLLGLNDAFETKSMKDQAVVNAVHKHGGAVIINHWFDGKGKEKEVYNALGVDGFEIENVGKDLYYNRDTFKELKRYCEEHKLIMVGGLDFHGYGRMCSVYNAFKIPDWDTMSFITKEQEVLKILKSGQQDRLTILMYKDRPFYTDAYLIFRPFWTVVMYFRTLHISQLLSWFVWLLIFVTLRRREKIKNIKTDKVLPVFALLCSLFLISLGLVYYVRGEAVKGYSKVYSEYFSILCPIGLLLFIYTGVLVYFRFFKSSK